MIAEYPASVPNLQHEACLHCAEQDLQEGALFGGDPNFGHSGAERLMAEMLQELVLGGEETLDVLEELLCGRGAAGCRCH
jgi:hypothetical protein